MKKVLKILLFLGLIVVVGYNSFILYLKIDNVTFKQKLMTEKLNYDTVRYYKINKEIRELQKLCSIPDIKKLQNGVVFIEDIFGMGSGVVIRKTNEKIFILTCYHVVEDTIKINKELKKEAKELSEEYDTLSVTVGYYKSATIRKGTLSGEVTYNGYVVKYNKKYDLALIEIEIVDDNLEILPVALKEPDIGDEIYAVGYPLGVDRNVSKGILSSKTDDFLYYVIDTMITFGNSGGGAFNNKGELIGVPSRVCGYGNRIPESSMGLIVRLEHIKEFLKEKKK